MRSPNLVLGLVVLLAASCGSFLEEDTFEIESTTHAAVATFPPRLDGNWMVYFADEGETGSAGTDLNGDTDTDDVVAVAVEISRRREVSTEVAAEDAYVVFEEIFLVVDEAVYGSNLQTADTGDELVLVHWDRVTEEIEFVDTLAAPMGSPCLVPFQNRLYYASAEALVDPDATSIRYVTSAEPTMPVIAVSDGAGQYEAALLGERNGLFFCALRERVGEGDLNGDGDEDDGAVLGLFDGEDPVALVHNVGLAMPEGAEAFDTREFVLGDWLVAFLVSEEEQNEDLNDPGLFDTTWLPEACPGTTADGVVTGQSTLFYLRYRDWLVGATDPINTGLVGAGRVVALDDYVATVTNEATLGCDLNMNGFTDDLVPRWVEAVAVDEPILPSVAVDDMVALALLPGDAQGITGLRSRFVVSVSEAEDGRDFDGKPEQNDLIASRDPSDSEEATWTFEHRSGVGEVQGENFVTTEPYVGATWMADVEVATRLPIAYRESVSGVVLNVNLDCDFVPKDTDTTDSVATWPRLRSSLERAVIEPDFPMTFPGLGYSVLADNPGFTVVGSIMYFRVDENADGRDYNDDMDTDDVVLVRTPVGSGCPIDVLGVCDTSPGPVVHGGLEGLGFLTDEAMAGEDLNGDGDLDDTVVRYVVF